MAPKKLRILVVDDHPVFRHGLARLINEEKDLQVCAEAQDAAEALAAIKKWHPDLVVVDISLNGTDGIELTKALRLVAPRTPVLVLSMYKESLYAERALRAGARGYIMKQEPPEKILAALRRVVSGDIYVSDSVGSRMLEMLATGKAYDGASPLQKLSDRELQVFQLIGHGRGTRQIADELHLSVKTIESYRAHIKEKMNLQTSYELVQSAIYWNQHAKVS
jgi:DNA-binding NarL/FixJ family response regulator